MPSLCSRLRLNDLPPPLSGQTGWPWTEDGSGSALENLADLKTASYPRISIITPSYNQGNFIEATIRSVLLQGYPNLEYIIMDGGSTDQTVELIRRYEPWITAWVSAGDRGQSHAINQGLARASGDILAYLNSDDYYLPGALLQIAEYHQQLPNADLLHGRCRYVDAAGTGVIEQFGQISSLDEIVDLWEVWWAQRQFVQPEVFWTRSIMQRVGSFREQLHYGMDYDYWCRILAAGGTVGRVDAAIACFRLTPQQKSSQRGAVAAELLMIVQPLLWPESSSGLPTLKRWQLQGKWLYQAIFLEQVARSLAGGDTRSAQASHRPLWRWVKSVAVLLQHPKIFLVPAFQRRIRQAVSRLLGFRLGT